MPVKTKPASKLVSLPMEYVNGMSNLGPASTQLLLSLKAWCSLIDVLDLHQAKCNNHEPNTHKMNLRRNYMCAKIISIKRDMIIVTNCPLTRITKRHNIHYI